MMSTPRCLEIPSPVHAVLPCITPTTTFTLCLFDHHTDRHPTLGANNAQENESEGLSTGKGTKNKKDEQDRCVSSSAALEHRVSDPS